MAESEESGRRLIDYWKCEGLIAEEHGDSEQARKYFEKAEMLARRAADLTSARRTTSGEPGDASAASQPSPDGT